MEFEKKHFGTTASQIIITAENDLEAEGIENCLSMAYKVRGAYVKSLKDGKVSFTIYPRASRYQLRGLKDLREFVRFVKIYMENPTEELGRGLETQF